MFTDQAVKIRVNPCDPWPISLPTRLITAVLAYYLRNRALSGNRITIGTIAGHQSDHSVSRADRTQR